MAGFIYRTAVAIKDFGERHNLPCLIRLGLAIRERVKKLPVKYFVSGSKRGEKPRKN